MDVCPLRPPDDIQALAQRFAAASLRLCVSLANPVLTFLASNVIPART